ncbi:MAG TPA: HAD family phosphatase [Streptosporangiaceae bacterium]|nr:HAD family phosphatase [Streptosporangiaceae bacterium]
MNQPPPPAPRTPRPVPPPGQQEPRSPHQAGGATYRRGASHQIPRAAVVFDCDGLLVSTQGSWDRAYAELSARYGRQITSAARHALVGLQLGPLGHALAELLGRPAPPAQLSDEIHALVESNIGAGHRAMPGAIALVTALHGTRPLAVASNTPSEIVRSYLEPCGLLDAFDVILGNDHVSRPKPAPDIYQLACQHLGSDPAASVAFEDSPTGAAAALAAGLYLIGVPSAPDLVFPAHRHVTTLGDPALWQALGLPSQALTA